MTLQHFDDSTEELVDDESILDQDYSSESDDFLGVDEDGSDSLSSDDDEL